MKCIKKKYISFVHAKWDADQLAKKNNEAYEVYMCRKGCNCFHVGSVATGDLYSNNSITQFKQKKEEIKYEKRK